MGGKCRRLVTSARCAGGNLSDFDPATIATMKTPRRSCDIRGISLRLWLQLSCDFGSDYEILKTICDYATLTRPAPSPMPCPEPPPLPPCKFQPRSAGLPTWTATPDRMGLCRHCPPRCPGRHKIPDRVQLATPGKRPVQGLYCPCNSVIVRRPYHDGTSKPTQSDNIGR